MECEEEEIQEDSEGKVESSDTNTRDIMGMMVMLEMMKERIKEQQEEKKCITKSAYGIDRLEMESSKTANAKTSLLAKGKPRMKLRQGITMDSGSHHNVMPKRMVNKKRIRASEFSRRGVHYIAANKGKIPNEGETTFEFETLEGELEYWDFQIAEVNKALASIADRVDHNCRVVFDKDEKTGQDASYILNKTTKRVIKMTRVGNVWKIDAIVEVGNTNHEESGFVRRG